MKYDLAPSAESGIIIHKYQELEQLFVTTIQALRRQDVDANKKLALFVRTAHEANLVN
jgi:hypothetical protein